MLAYDDHQTVNEVDEDTSLPLLFKIIFFSPLMIALILIIFSASVGAKLDLLSKDDA